MKTTPAPVRHNPPSTEAVELAHAWAGRTFKDEAEAMVALEIAFEDAIQIGIQKMETINK